MPTSMTEQLRLVESELSGPEDVPAHEYKPAFRLDPFDATGGELINPPCGYSIRCQVECGANRHTFARVSAYLVIAREHTHGWPERPDELIDRLQALRFQSPGGRLCCRYDLCRSSASKYPVLPLTRFRATKITVDSAEFLRA